jgi:2-polyprenyl-6-methoxyphenol hydroxylase-like FAD-dependent oxidoreductase
MARRGLNCRIVEMKEAFDVVGAGMYTQGNALRALLDIGIVEEIIARGWHSADDTSEVTDADGNLLAKVTYPRIAGPSVPSVVTVSRRVLHGILQEAAHRQNVPVTMGTSVTAIVDDPSRPRVQVNFTDGSSDDFDLVVGADGIHSVVRDLTFGVQEPHYTGFVNWRVVLPRPAAATKVTWMNGDGVTLGAIPISDSELYLAGVMKDPVNRWLDRAGIFALVKQRFAEFGGVGRQLLDQITPAHDIVYTPIFEVKLAPPWYRGRVVVLGDAAHASTPFWAQGASMAIEDVILLARLIEAGAPLAALLPEWMERRKDRCLWVQRGSRQTGERSHEEGLDVRAKLNQYLAADLQKDVIERYGRFAEAI